VLLVLQVAASEADVAAAVASLAVATGHPAVVAASGVGAGAQGGTLPILALLPTSFPQLRQPERLSSSADLAILHPSWAMWLLLENYHSWECIDTACYDQSAEDALNAQGYKIAWVVCMSTLIG
jgi:hypothetical protein